MTESATVTANPERYRALAALLDSARTPITSEFIEDFTARHSALAGIFAGATFGSIQWQRHLGRPSSPQMSAGFAIAHEAKQHVVVDPDDGQGPVLDVWLPLPADTPILWDGPHDDEHFRVSYLAFAAPPTAGIEFFRTEITATPWIPTGGRGVLVVNPSAFAFEPDGSCHYLPQQTVSRIRIAQGGLLQVITNA